MLLSLASCKSKVEEGLAEHVLFDLTVPAANTDSKSTVELLNEMNRSLKERYPNHPSLPIIIERHPHPKLDEGDRMIDVTFPEQTLGDRIKALSYIYNHWSISDNGYLIFKTWHRPQYDWDDEEVKEFLE